MLDKGRGSSHSEVWYRQSSVRILDIEILPCVFVYLEHGISWRVNTLHLWKKGLYCDIDWRNHHGQKDQNKQWWFWRRITFGLSLFIRGHHSPRDLAEDLHLGFLSLGLETWWYETKNFLLSWDPPLLHCNPWIVMTQSRQISEQTFK